MPIAIPYRVRVRAREEGTLDQWYRLQPVSLDRLMNEEERAESNLVATLVAPAIPQTPPPVRDESTRAFVEQLLSYLSPRAQAVLRLRHGLVAEDDERPRTTGEIAQELGIAPDEVSAAEKLLPSRGGECQYSSSLWMPVSRVVTRLMELGSTVLM
jgi:DNA-directed RNA polymerase sigma subunit (sigma70/sigma32)